MCVRLHAAASDGHALAVSALASAGARVNCLLSPQAQEFQARGWTPLFSTVYFGHLAAARRLLELGANVSRTTEMSCTPLDMAIAGPSSPSDSAHTVQLLAEYGADIHRYNAAGWQPVHAAAYLGRCASLVRLAEFGANLTAITRDSGRTPRELAQISGRNFTLIVLDQLLLRKAAGELARRKIERKRASSPQAYGFDDDGAEGDVGGYSEVISAETIRETAHKIPAFSDEDGSRMEQEILDMFPPSCASQDMSQSLSHDDSGFHSQKSKLHAGHI